MATIAEHCQSITESVQRIVIFCQRHPVSDLAKDAGLVAADVELQDLVSLLEETTEEMEGL